MELIDGAALLDKVRAFNDRFVALPGEAARVFVPLWVAHAHLLEVFDSTPRAAFMSPEPGSGKTRQLEVIETLTPNAMHAAGVSLPVLFRSVASMKPTPTILHDEIDVVFGPKAKEHENLRGFLNSGHRRGAKYYRCVGEGSKQESVPFPSYSALAVAGLGNIPRTVRQRSVVVRMHRRAPHEKVEPFRHRIHSPEGNELRDRLAAWADQVREHMAGRYPVMPEGVEDRDADVWEPLIMVADAAGGDWPETARAACQAFVSAGKTPEAASLGVRLLHDVRKAFGENGRIGADALVGALVKTPDAPWSKLHGEPITRSELKRMLADYGVEDKKIRFGKKTEMGYYRAAFAEAWTRYPLPEKPEQSERAEHRSSQDTDLTPELEYVPEHHDEQEHRAPTLTRDVPEVPDVPGTQEGDEEIGEAGFVGRFVRLVAKTERAALALLSLTADDRFPCNRDSIAERHLAYAQRALHNVESVLEPLAPNKEVSAAVPDSARISRSAAADSGKRPSLTGEFGRLAFELDNRCARLARHARDERFATSRDEIATDNYQTLAEIHRALAETTDRLKPADSQSRTA
ncbi:MAG: DUF3631 domain-containing protein [Segniliparus sp.]|uniref:DUF3631 domain-containing protein n=1 Tax=Segniliparus sp. TaxID=2804064 RepID=UPI003F35962E